MKICPNVKNKSILKLSVIRAAKFQRVTAYFINKSVDKRLSHTLLVRIQPKKENNPLKETLAISSKSIYVFFDPEIQIWEIYPEDTLPTLQKTYIKGYSFCRKKWKQPKCPLWKGKAAPDSQ